ncbi:ribosomal large subunit pseudouridine synthase B [Oryctolagus cuniculus]|uniref:ribosomal large subunit pseudouridine synthase B n=1 Tax=Oryctolagus cuniculus TaxID=9986 RepID=UPI003879A942
MRQGDGAATPPPSPRLRARGTRGPADAASGPASCGRCCGPSGGARGPGAAAGEARGGPGAYSGPRSGGRLSPAGPGEICISSDEFRGEAVGVSTLPVAPPF